MNISDWPMSRIMQLPDEAFGRRFPIGIEARPAKFGRMWFISDLSLPEYTVFWELVIHSWFPEKSRFELRMALGDSVPTTQDEMTAFEPLFADFGDRSAIPKVFQSEGNMVYSLRRLRYPVRTSGRRLVVEMRNSAAEESMVGVMVVVSSIPKDIPSWFGSG